MSHSVRILWSCSAGYRPSKASCMEWNTEVRHHTKSGRSKPTQAPPTFQSSQELIPPLQGGYAKPESQYQTHWSSFAGFSAAQHQQSRFSSFSCQNPIQCYGAVLEQWAHSHGRPQSSGECSIGWWSTAMVEYLQKKDPAIYSILKNNGIFNVKQFHDDDKANLR